MSETPSNPRSSHPDALREYETGLSQKQQGLMDPALTSFRRAVIADPNFAEAQFQIGTLCRDKGRLDKMFQRYAFDAFRVAARLDPTNQAAHDQYILSAQENGRIDELYAEYDALAKKNPENELYQRCRKNLLTLQMAMIPQRVDVAGSRASGGMRKFTLLISLGMILVGLGCVFLIGFFRKNPGNIQWTGVMKAGIGLIALGFGGVFAFTRMR